MCLRNHWDSMILTIAISALFLETTFLIFRLQVRPLDVLNELKSMQRIDENRDVQLLEILGNLRAELNTRVGALDAKLEAKEKKP